jgi:mannose-6-phosphate isomerase-like protein (cupin superfamily)
MTGWIGDIEQESVSNTNFRRVVFTGKHQQLVVMSLEPGEDIGLEVHPDNDQFIRVERGQATVSMGPTKEEVTERQAVDSDWAFVVPAGTWHNVVNKGDAQLKIYTIYAPPHHPDGTVHETKADAQAAEAGKGGH